MRCGFARVATSRAVAPLDDGANCTRALNGHVHRWGRPLLSCTVAGAVRWPPARFGARTTDRSRHTGKTGSGGDVEVPPVRVLIVDDQEPFRRAAASVVELTDPFVVVGAAESGEDCLAAVPAARPDLVLMDVGLPGMDGMQAARRLSTLRQPPIVVLVSTHDEEEFGDEVRACGAVAYIKKSEFDSRRLAAAWALGSRGSATRTSASPAPRSASSS